MTRFYLKLRGAVLIASFLSVLSMLSILPAGPVSAHADPDKPQISREKLRDLLLPALNSQQPISVKHDLVPEILQQGINPSCGHTPACTGAFPFDIDQLPFNLRHLNHGYDNFACNFLIPGGIAPTSIVNTQAILGPNQTSIGVVALLHSTACGTYYTLVIPYQGARNPLAWIVGNGQNHYYTHSVQYDGTILGFSQMIWDQFGTPQPQLTAYGAIMYNGKYYVAAVNL